MRTGEIGKRKAESRRAVHSGLLRRLSAFRFLPLAFLVLLFAAAETAAAADKPLVRLKLELLSIRNRSSGPLPVHVKLEYNQPQILDGDLELDGAPGEGGERGSVGVGGDLDAEEAPLQGEGGGEHAVKGEEEGSGEEYADEDEEP